MAQAIYLDAQDGFGPRDFTKFIYELGKFQYQKNDPSVFDFKVVPVSGVSNWTVPTRGAYIRVEDDRWDSRVPGVGLGVVWTGYVTEDPAFQFLGVGPDGGEVWGYQVNCTSDDYLAQTKQLPAVTYINKPRGQILKDLLQLMFAGGDVFPFNTDNVYDGGTERVYYVDPGKTFAQIATDFANADGFSYYVLDHFMVYAPQSTFLPNSSDPKIALRVDEQDPRYVPDALQLERAYKDVINDVTVFGNDEASTLVKEHYVSDGYTGSFQLAFIPYGLIENSLLKDDFTGNSIDTSIWLEEDNSSNYIQAFDGSLNIVGGVDDGSVFLRSIKGTELSGILQTRDGELQLPPDASGTGIIGGLYTTAGLKMQEADLACGWYLDLDAKVLYPYGPSGKEVAAGVSLNTAHDYVLRKTITVDRPNRALTSYTSPSTLRVFGADSPSATATISWTLEEINADNPSSVIHTTTTVLTKQYADFPDFAIYAPVVTYGLHVVMNYVEVFRPPQVSVSVDGVPVQVGNYLDGGRCTITTDVSTSNITSASGALYTPTNNGSASQTNVQAGTATLNWYAIPQALQYTRSGGTAADIVTIPAQGAQVEITYWKADQSRARVQNLASIARERQKFHDDGLRQWVINQGQVTPTPRTSEECQFLAQAYLDDRQYGQFQGTYSFVSVENDATELRIWPMPGDLLPLLLTLPDGSVVDETLQVANVDVTMDGDRAYAFNLTFGPVNRYDLAIRSLVNQRESSLDDFSITTIPISTVEVLNQGLVRPDDPGPVTITAISSTAFTIQMDSSLPSGVVGYEVRTDDTGWGQANCVARFTSNTHTFTRGLRDLSYYVKPYNAGGLYSVRSAFVRVQYPLSNTMAITGVDGTISPDFITVTIPLPTNPDFAGVIVRQDNSAGTVIYYGDGITAKTQVSGVNLLPGSGNMVLQIPNSSAVKDYTVWIAPYNLIGEFGTTATFNLNKPDPNVTNLTPTASDPNVWTWSGSNADSYDINIFDSNGSLIGSDNVPGDQTFYNLGNGDIQRTIEIVGLDSWGSGGNSTATHDADTGVPTKPQLQLSLSVADQANAPTGSAVVGCNVVFPQPYNLKSATKIQVQWSSDSSFTTYQHAEAPTIADAVSLQLHAPKQFLYFRAYATNAFGDGPYSDTIPFNTGDPLNPLSPDSNGWDYGSPSFKGGIRLTGPSGYSLTTANDGTGRSITGLNTQGYVALNILNGIDQYDPSGIARTLINVANNVSALANGSVVETGGIRGYYGLDGNYYLTSRLLSSVLWYDASGTPRSGYLLGYNTLDSVSDGGTYARTTYGQRHAADKADGAINDSNLLQTGIYYSPGGGFVGNDSLWGGAHNALNAIDWLGGSSWRVTHAKVDSDSILQGGVRGANIDSNILTSLSNGATPPQPGDPGYDTDVQI